MGSFALMTSGAALLVALAGAHSRAEGPEYAESVAPSQVQVAQASGEAAQTETTEAERAESEAAEGEAEEMPEFTEEVLQDPEAIAVGGEIWAEQCRHCHGASAYPGKAPRLRPSRYTPDFVYHRVTEGFRGMPAWKDVYSDEERVAVTAYILSRQFSP